MTGFHQGASIATEMCNTRLADIQSLLISMPTQLHVSPWLCVVCCEYQPIKILICLKGQK